MRRDRLGAGGFVAAVVLVGVCLCLGSPTQATALAAVETTHSPTSTVVYDPRNPATWTNAQLAAQLTFCGVRASDWRAARSLSARGIGGIVLLGDGASPRLRRQLSLVRRAAPHGVAPFIASDEEGGRVQRLSHVIYPLPSAWVMGTWRTDRIRSTARAYGSRMRSLGVWMSFGPVADIAVHGRYIHTRRRAFSSDPAEVAADVDAWSLGMRQAGVVPVVKHWPGHGSATDSHVGIASLPAVGFLARRDMVPFDEVFRRGAPAVMVGHLTSRGLTERGVPASLSPRAMRYLRSRAGSDTVIITDSLSMGAASSALRISPATAAVRSLRAGADVALVCSGSPTRVVEAVRRAIRSGALPRGRAVASVRRVLRLKARSGLMPSRTGS